MKGKSLSQNSAWIKKERTDYKAMHSCITRYSTISLGECSVLHVTKVFVTEKSS